MPEIETKPEIQVNKFEKLVESSPCIIAHFDDSARLLYVNSSFERATGFSSDSVIGKKFSEIGAPEGQSAVVERIVRKVIATGIDETVDLVYLGRVYLSRFVPCVGECGNIESVILYGHDITERKKMDEIAWESRERLARTIETIPEGVVILDRGGQITYANKSGEQILGIKNDLIKNKLYNDPAWKISAVGGNPFTEEELLFKRVMQSGTAVYNVVHAIEHADGTRAVISINAAPLKDAAGTITGVVTVVTDITERERTENTLRESERRLRSILDAAPFGAQIYELKPDNRLVFSGANRSNDRILHMDSGKLIGKDIEEAFPGLNDTPVPDIFRHTARTGEGYRQEQLFYEAMGISGVYEIYAFKTEPSRMAVIFYEITERVKARERLEQSYQRLQKTQNDTIKAISRLVEIRDPYTAGHQRRVAQLSFAMAHEMGLEKDRAEGIRTAGLLHDIGKFNVPSEILSKPGRLTLVEFEVIKIHPWAGYDILKLIDFPWPVAEVAYQHQERLNGTGYPRNLVKEDILLEAKIVMVADVVEAMSFFRPYRQVVGLDKALAEITANKGVLYDTDAVDICLKLFKEKGFAFEK